MKSLGACAKAYKRDRVVGLDLATAGAGACPSDMDVRDFGGRIGCGLFAIACGIAGASVTLQLIVYVPGEGTGAQRGLFFVASAVMAFLLCGTAGGIAYLWRTRHRADRDRIPPAVARSRSRDRAT